MAEPTDEQLRESARHRGLKLLKSRRRKPGGDFGLYGLADTGGTAVFGSGDDGLTATAAEVAAYLRRGDAATWATSVDETPARERPRAKAKAAPQSEPEPAIAPRPSRRTRPTQAPRVETPPPPNRTKPSRPRPTPAPASPPMPPPAPPPSPRPVLAIRPATRADAAGVAALLPDTDAAAIAERLAAAIAAGEAPLVADEGGVVGCLAWHVLPTLQHGPIARLTFLAVAPAQQRRGIGRRLVEALADAARTRDLPLVEAISDIGIASAHGFFRRLGFSQTSYRFARASDADRSAAASV